MLHTLLLLFCLTVAAAHRMDNPRRAAHIKHMADSTDILIVGGGLNGSILALALAQSGLKSKVVDALPEPTRLQPDFDGRSYAMALTSCRLLQNLSLWEALAPHAQPILDIKVSDGRAGEGPSPFFMHFNHAEIEEGPMGHMIEDRHLRSALQQAMADRPEITQISQTEVSAQSLASNGINAALSDGTNVRAKLL